MDGFAENVNTIVIAAPTAPMSWTRPYCAPAASTRQVVVPLPTFAAAEEILRVPCAQSAGRPLRRSCASSPRHARLRPAPTWPTWSTKRPCAPAEAKSKKVLMKHFEFAKEKIFISAERRSIVMPEAERRNTAYHESGHAVVRPSA